MLRSILVINPGSTSTKSRLYEDGAELFNDNAPISSEIASASGSIFGQLPFRERQLRAALAGRGFDLERLSLVMGRGGLLRPLGGGIYRVETRHARGPLLGPLWRAREQPRRLLADRIAAPLGIEAYIADPVVVDELWDVSRVTGHRLFSQPLDLPRPQSEGGRKALVQGKRTSPTKKRGSSSPTWEAAFRSALHLEARVVDVNNALRRRGALQRRALGNLAGRGPCQALLFGESTSFARSCS